MLYFVRHYAVERLLKYTLHPFLLLGFLSVNRVLEVILQFLDVPLQQAIIVLDASSLPRNPPYVVEQSFDNLLLDVLLVNGIPPPRPLDFGGHAVSDGLVPLLILLLFAFE